MMCAFLKPGPLPEIPASNGEKMLNTHKGGDTRQGAAHLEESCPAHSKATHTRQCASYGAALCGTEREGLR